MRYGSCYGNSRKRQIKNKNKMADTAGHLKKLSVRRNKVVVNEVVSLYQTKTMLKTWKKIKNMKILWKLHSPS